MFQTECRSNFKATRELDHPKTLLVIGIAVIMD